MRVICILLLSSFLAFPPLVSAVTHYDVPLIICNGCSYEEIRSKARSNQTRPDFEMALWEKYKTTVTIFNFEANAVFAFDVSWQHRLQPPHFLDTIIIPLEITETMVDQDIEQALFNIDNAKNVIMSAQFEVPESIARSAWDLPGAGYIQNQVADFIISDMNLLDQLSTIVSSLVVIFKGADIDVVEITVTATFSDGSEAYFNLEGYDHNSDPIFSFDYGKDVDGNFVSQAASAYMHGAYNFDSGGIRARDSFIGAGERLGIDLIFIPQGEVVLGPLARISHSASAN